MLRQAFMNLAREAIKDQPTADPSVVNTTADGRARKEKEYTFYAKLRDVNQLDRAAACLKQEQWEIKVPLTDRNACSGRIRVRREANGDVVNYFITFKTKGEDEITSTEIELPSTEEQFIQFKFMAFNGMIKDRYVFPVIGSDLKWEVDCFKDGSKGYHDWVKIDLEVSDAMGEIPAFPILLDDIIYPKNFDAHKPEDEQIVQQLYDKLFLQPNPYRVKLDKQREAAAKKAQAEKEAQAAQPAQHPEPAPNLNEPAPQQSDSSELGAAPDLNKPQSQADDSKLGPAPNLNQSSGQTKTGTSDHPYGSPDLKSNPPNVPDVKESEDDLFSSPV